MKAALARVLADAPPQADIGKPRLPVDRVFKLQGIGTVVTGTLNGGALRRGQTVVIQPSGKTARVRNIQSHGRDVEMSGPGTRTALNLSLDAVEDIHRGDVITLSDFGGPSKVLDVLIEISPRATSAIKDGARVHAHHGSGNVAARVAFREDMELAAGEHAVAQLRLEAPAFVFAGDRFIVRDWAERNTLGGAIVLDPDGNRKLFRADSRVKFLGERAQSPTDASRLCRVASRIRRRHAQVPIALEVSLQCGEISAAVSRLAAAGAVVLAGDFVVDAARWQALGRRAAEAIDARHRAHPEQSGLPLTDLRAALGDELPVAELLDDVVADLCARRVCACRRGYPPGVASARAASSASGSRREDSGHAGGQAARSPLAKRSRAGRRLAAGAAVPDRVRGSR